MPILNRRYFRTGVVERYFTPEEAAAFNPFQDELKARRFKHAANMRKYRAEHPEYRTKEKTYKNTSPRYKQWLTDYRRLKRMQRKFNRWFGSEYPMKHVRSIVGHVSIHPTYALQIWLFFVLAYGFGKS